MRLIDNIDDFEIWLNDNYGFEDRYVNEIKTQRNQNGGIDSVELRLGYQIKGTYQGGTPITLKEYIIKGRNVKLWTFNEETSYNPDNCIERLDVIDNCDGIGFEFSGPELIRLICGTITIEGPFFKETVSKPWVSEREVFIHTKDMIIPEPIEWIKWLLELGFDVSWRYCYGEAKDVEKVPYPNYSGWFIQETYKIPETQFGIFFMHIGFNNNKTSLHLIKYEDTCEKLWDAVIKIFAIKSNVEILSGNCRFNGKQWLEYLDSKSIPDNMYNW